MYGISFCMVKSEPCDISTFHTCLMTIGHENFFDFPLIMNVHVTPFILLTGHK